MKLIKVHVFPESHKDTVVRLEGDLFEVYVRAGAQHGHANKVVTSLLAKYFGISARMVSGGTRTHKIFRIG
jgi:uncharacterized protein (TIGR00251 family)